MKKIYRFRCEADPSFVTLVKYYPKSGNYYVNTYHNYKKIYSNYCRTTLYDICFIYGIEKTAIAFGTTEKDITTRVLKGMK